MFCFRVQGLNTPPRPLLEQKLTSYVGLPLLLGELQCAPRYESYYSAKKRLTFGPYNDQSRLQPEDEKQE